MQTPFRTAIALSALWLASPTNVVAQDGPYAALSPGNTLLTVQGEGSSDAEPDLAVFNAGVQTQGDTAQAALAENSRAMAQVVAALRRLGIAERDIQTENLSVSPVYTDPQRDAMMAMRSGVTPPPPLPPEQQVPQIVGYQVFNNVTVRQRRLDDYGPVIDALVAAGANRVDGPMLQLENDGAATDEARRAAVAEARRKAELYAAASGLRIVRTVAINEGGNYIRPTAVRMMSMDVGSRVPPPPPAPFQRGELSVQANVSVVYELAPR